MLSDKKINYICAPLFLKDNKTYYGKINHDERVIDFINNYYSTPSSEFIINKNLNIRFLNDLQNFINELNYWDIEINHNSFGNFIFSVQSSIYEVYINRAFICILDKAGYGYYYPKYINNEDILIIKDEDLDVDESVLFEIKQVNEDVKQRIEDFIKNKDIYLK